MALLPEFRVGWLNGWILLVVYGLVFGAVVWSFPRQVITRLYDKSHWTRKQRVLTSIGKVLGSALFLLLVFSPLRIGHAVFVVGTAVFALGLIGVVVALLNFRSAPPGQPATQGLYRVSRNPQSMMLALVFLGVCLTTGSWAALLLLAVVAVCYHFRIRAEERSCLAQYGDAYWDYTARVPRYLPFF
jgi:protein-S-isoprenylcysteine O-methyltransferase Ste14